jgi:quercetin dioxygenase-like cupin family protein
MSQDTTVKKVQADASPTGDMNQKYLVSGKAMGMRMWQNEPPTEGQGLHERPYETVGYVIAGKAKLHLEGQEVLLEAGDSWLVPAGAAHRYEIVEELTAVEATSPPARIDHRDEPAS